MYKGGSNKSTGGKSTIFNLKNGKYLNLCQLTQSRLKCLIINYLSKAHGLLDSPNNTFNLLNDNISQ